LGLFIAEHPVKVFKPDYWNSIYVVHWADYFLKKELHDLAVDVNDTVIISNMSL
jgi:hypothetical protein